MSQLIFFDLDGTLIDTSERQYRVYRDILDFYGVQSTLSKEEFWNQKRMGKKTVELLPKDFPKEFVQKFMGESLKRIEDRKYLKYDNLLRESLDVLSKIELKNDLILVTLRNNRENLLWELNNLELAKYFKEILVGSPLKLKNKVLLVKEYIKKCSKNSFIIVGDTEADISTGKELEILTVAVTYGIRSKDFLKKLEPDFYLDSISGLTNILERISDKA